MKDKELKFNFGDTAYLKAYLPEAVPGQILKYNQKRKMYVFLRFTDVSDLSEGFARGYVKEEDLATPEECNMCDYTKENGGKPYFLKDVKLSKTKFIDFYYWDLYLEKSLKDGKISRKDYDLISSFLLDYEKFKLKYNSELIIKQKYKRNLKRWDFNEKEGYFYKK